MAVKDRYIWTAPSANEIQTPGDNAPGVWFLPASTREAVFGADCFV